MKVASSTIIYLHGFQSSAWSQKAVILKEYLADNHPEIVFLSPNLPFSPHGTLEVVKELLTQHPNAGLMGSSMGGFYSAYLSQQHQLSAVLINPVVSAGRLFEELLGVELKNDYTGEQYCLDENDMDLFRDIASAPLSSASQLSIYLETGDEVLDYRLAEKKYKICEPKVFEGGDHRFQNFESCLGEMVEFLSQA